MSDTKYGIGKKTKEEEFKLVWKRLIIVSVYNLL